MKMKLKIVKLFSDFQIKLIKLILFLMGFLFLLMPLLLINQKRYQNFSRTSSNVLEEKKDSIEITFSKQTFQDYFDINFFAQNIDNKGFYLKNKFNNFFVQLSRYLQGKSIKKSGPLSFTYKKLFNLLPNIWRKFNKELEISKSKNLPEKVIKVFFEFVLSHEEDYKMLDFLNILLSILNTFKESNSDPKFQSLFTLLEEDEKKIESRKKVIDELLSEMDEKDKKVVEKKIMEEKQKDIEYLKKTFFQFLGINEKENSTKLLLKISTVKEPRYSESLKIRREIKELERDGYKAILDFDVRFIPLKFDFGFDNEFNYLSFIHFISQTLKFIYLKISINRENLQGLSFADFLGSSWDTKDDEILLEIKDDFTKIIFDISFNIEIKTGENGWITEKNKYLFDLLKILTNRQYKDKSYFDISTGKCKDSVLIEIPLNALQKWFTGLVDFENNNGGLCRVKKTESNNGQINDSPETFKLFSLIQDFQNWIDTTSIKLEEFSNQLDNDQKIQLEMLKNINLKDKLKENMMKSFSSFINPKKIFETSKMIKQELHENLQKLSEIKIDDSDNQDRSTRSWFLLAYNALFQNFVVLENDLIEKFIFFKNQNMHKITKMLKNNRMNNSIIWKRLYFQVEHCFTKKDKITGEKVLVLMLIENNKRKTKHTFVLRQTNVLQKVVYYASNHYEYLLDHFLNKYVGIKLTEIEQD